MNRINIINKVLSAFHCVEKVAVTEKVVVVRTTEWMFDIDR
jgi:hypothetical protein